MNDAEQIQDRHLAELTRLESIAEEMGYPTELIKRSGEIAYHTLLLGLEPDAGGRAKQLALNFYPLSKEDVEHSLFLQYFVDLPIVADEDGLARIREVLPDMNNKVILGHFGIGAGTQRLHYRYVQTLPADEMVTLEAVADVILMTGYTPMVFEGLLEELAQGTISVEEARARVEGVYADA